MRSRGDVARHEETAKIAARSRLGKLSWAAAACFHFIALSSFTVCWVYKYLNNNSHSSAVGVEQQLEGKSEIMRMRNTHAVDTVYRGEFGYTDKTATKSILLWESEFQTDILHQIHLAQKLSLVFYNLGKK